MSEDARAKPRQPLRQYPTSANTCDFDTNRPAVQIANKEWSLTLCDECAMQTYHILHKYLVEAGILQGGR